MLGVLFFLVSAFGAVGYMIGFGISDGSIIWGCVGAVWALTFLGLMALSD